MANKVDRRKSRAIAMEMIYSGTVNERDFEITDEFLEDFSRISDTTQTLDKRYIREVVELAEAREGHFRAVITPYLKDWDIHRISRVNLAILRISVTELLYLHDIPPRVSINEAIELAKTYSDQESTSFVNGVLDRVLKAREEGLLPEWSPEMELAFAEEKTEMAAELKNSEEPEDHMELSAEVPEASQSELAEKEPSEAVAVELPEEESLEEESLEEEFLKEESRMEENLQDDIP